MITVAETYTCDGCGATTRRVTGERAPDDWCFLGHIYEDHDSGRLLLCPLCVGGTGFADRLRERQAEHCARCDPDMPLDDETPGTFTRPS